MPPADKYLRLFSRAARRLHIQGAIRPLDRKVKRVILGHHRGGARSGFGCHSWFCPSPNSEDGAEPGRLTRPAQSSKRVARGRRAAAGSEQERDADGRRARKATADRPSAQPAPLGGNGPAASGRGGAARVPPPYAAARRAGGGGGCGSLFSRLSCTPLRTQQHCYNNIYYKLKFQPVLAACLSWSKRNSITDPLLGFLDSWVPDRTSRQLTALPWAPALRSHNTVYIPMDGSGIRILYMCATALLTRVLLCVFSVRPHCCFFLSGKQ